MISVERGLYLRQWGLPFDALAYLFGHDAMFWYRAEVALGRPSLVGTTVKCPEKLPEHLLADGKHAGLEGHKRYLSTTVAGGCLLGASVTPQASPRRGLGHYRAGIFLGRNLLHPMRLELNGTSAQKKSSEYFSSYL